MRLITNKQDTLIAVDILANAYADAPNINWMFSQSHQNLNYFFKVFVTDAIAKKGAYLTSNNRGVLLLYNLKTKHYSIISLCQKVYLICFILGIKKSIEVMRLQKLIKKYRPKTGLLGAALAIKNDVLKWETRFELKREMSQLFENSNLPIYAETTNLRISSIYKKIGFSTYYEMNHPYADLTIFFMKLDKT